MNNFKEMTDLDFVEREFANLSFMESNEPYQYICDNYQNHITRLNNDTKNNSIIDMLKVGWANCNVWNDDMLNGHFSCVYHSIIALKSEIEKNKKN